LLEIRLKELLEKKNVSIEELIKETKLARSTVATLASGLQPVRVELTTIFKICTALDCTLDDMFKLIKE